MNLKQRIAKMWDHGRGASVRAIGRAVKKSTTHVQRIIAELRREESPDDIQALLAGLIRVVKSFAIEREGHSWKVVNYDLRLGAQTETERNADLAAVIREAIDLWQPVPGTRV